MKSRHAKTMFLLLIVLVMLLFFFPAPQGGFQSKNGPTTPVNNLRLALAGLFLLLASGIVSASLFTVSSPTARDARLAAFDSLAASTGSASLRC